MRRFCVVFLSVFSSVFADLPEPPKISVPDIGPSLAEDEVNIISKLIEVNEKRLLAQKELQKKMALLKEQKEEFIRGNQTSKHAADMVFTASDVLGRIKKENLSYLFSSEYLEELIFFSSIAAKSNPVRP